MKYPDIKGAGAMRFLPSRFTALLCSFALIWAAPSLYGDDTMKNPASGISTAAAIAANETEIIWPLGEDSQPVHIISLSPGDEKEIRFMPRDGEKHFKYTLSVAEDGDTPEVVFSDEEFEYDESLGFSGANYGPFTKAVPPLRDSAIYQRFFPFTGLFYVDEAPNPKRYSDFILITILEPRQPVKFEYSPQKDENPDNVNVAGDFNGWNAGANSLEKGEDGVFRATVYMDPGEQKYKLVVDGNWISDPANPRQDGSGFGNSVIDVAGSKQLPLGMKPVFQDVAGFTGVQLELEDGEKLEKENLCIYVNSETPNQPVLKEKEGPDDSFVKAFEQTGEYHKDYTVSEQGLVQFSSEYLDRFGEATITVIAMTDTGRHGWIQFPVDSAEAPRSPRDEIIYYAFTDRFFDGEPERTMQVQDPRVHPLANYNGGDWPGIIQKIEEGYFDRLGVTTLWLSPVNQNTPKVHKESVEPGNYYTSYHGYWPTSLTDVNESFGSADDLRTLISKSHDHGMAVIFDFVVNHFHEDHPLLKENPHWPGTVELPDGRNNIRLFDEFQYTTWFEFFLPTLDYGKNADLVERMTDNAVWWLEEFGADGFRHDAVKHIQPNFWSRLTEKVIAYEEKLRDEGRGRRFYQVGETISGRGTINEFVGPGLLDGQFDFPLYWPLRDAWALGTVPLSDLAREALNSQRDYPAGAIMSPLLGNHDVVRFMAYADGDIASDTPDAEVKAMGFNNPPEVNHAESYEKLQAAFAFLFALPGAPMIYYGDEYGQTGAHDPDNRRMLRWGDERNELENTTFDAVAELAHARNGSVALRRGFLEVLHASDEWLVMVRSSRDEVVLIGLARKPAEESVTVELPAHWNGDLKFKTFITNELSLTAENNSITISGDSGTPRYGYLYARVK